MILSEQFLPGVKSTVRPSVLFFLLVLIFAVSSNFGQTTYAELINRGIQRKLAGDLAGAIADYTAAIEINSKVPVAFYNRGIARRDRKDFVGALADYTKAIELDPKYADAYGNRGIVRAEMNDVKGAMADFEIAIKLDPADPQPVNSRGFTRQEQGDHDAAIVDFTTAVKLAPKFAVAYVNRGYSRVMKRDYNGAIEDFTLAIAADPLYAKAYNNRANAHSQKGDLGEAIADYAKAIQLEPMDPMAYYNRGLVHAKLEDFDRSIADLTKALELDPGYSDARTARALVLAKKGSYSPALSDFEKAIGSERKNASIIQSRAWAKLYMNDGAGAHEDASEFLKRAGSKDPSSGYAIIIGYLGLRKSGAAANADEFLKSWIKQVPKDNWTTRILRFFSGELTAPRLLAIAADNGSLTEAHTYIGESKLFSGDRAGALLHFQWVKSNGAKDYTEYTLALRELDALDAVPK